MRDLGAAAYLACAWFWCIGGFFPVLLYLEFGSVSFLVFAVFNVLGAALFGFWRADGRLTFLARFGPGTRGFSALVAGYHVVFAVWLSLMLADMRPVLGFFAVTALCLALRGRLVALSWGVLALSAGLLIFIIGAPVPRVVPAQAPFLHQIAPLALGFLLAPWFDLTFHRAYALADRPRRAFVIGFGGVFAALLAGVWLGLDAFVGLTVAGGLAQPAVAAVAVLVIVQTGFTTAAHLVELDPGRQARWPALVVGAVAALHVAAWMDSPELLRLLGELTYRGFVFAIGALFPVLLIFGPTRRAALVAAVLTPCYTLGFVIGGAFAPFLSVAMLVLAAFYTHAGATRLAGETP